MLFSLFSKNIIIGSYEIMKRLFLPVLIIFISASAFSQSVSKNQPASETLKRTGKCSIFVRMLKQTGLDVTLKTGSYTIFAPSDMAFRTLPDSLLNDSTFITHIVNNSIVSGMYNKPALTRSITAIPSKTIQLKTLSGNMLTLHLNNNHNLEVYENQTPVAMVTTFDLPFSAGVIHLINQALIPQNKP